MYDTQADKKEWKELADFSKTVGNFYRIAIHPKTGRVAMVSYTGKKP